MNIQVTFSKTNKNIFVWKNQYIHSSYNPEKEAERFVENLNFDTKPKFLCILAPFSGYTYSFLKEKYPNTKLIAIEFFSHKSFESPKWDYLFNIEDNDLSNKLYTIIGEEKSLSTETIIWPTSERLFPDETQKALDHLRNFFHTSRDVLGTRLYFTEKWNKNAIRNISLAKHIVNLKKTNKALCILASGPSLEKEIEFLKTIGEQVLILALSSSLPVLDFHKISPDFCLTTDGGFWAKYHLSNTKNFQNTVFIAPLEAAIPLEILTHKKLHFLDYGDGFSHFLIDSISLNASLALRNGTVSGTAFYLAQYLSSNSIFYFGLDLASSKSFPHSQPNALESYNSSFDFRLNPKEDRIEKAHFSSLGSLAIYENWFKNLAKPHKKFYRIKPKSYSFSNSFPYIKDIDENQVLEILKKENSNLDLSIVAKKNKLEIKENTIKLDKKKLQLMIETFKSQIESLEYDKKDSISLNLCSLLKEISLKEYLDFTKKDEKESFLKLKEKSLDFLRKSLEYL